VRGSEAELSAFAVELRPVDPATARQIVDGYCPDGYAAPEDYPGEGDRVAAQVFLEACAADVDPRPYGVFLICLPAEPRPLVIGGIGFHGAPDEDGSVDVGYAVVPSHQGCGYASAALSLLILYARDLGAGRLRAETDGDNVASQRVLTRNGFRPVPGYPSHFERALP
jgi:RimJ/RimL family protein N-acetyltransferase